MAAAVVTTIYPPIYPPTPPFSTAAPSTAPTAAQAARGGAPAAAPAARGGVQAVNGHRPTVSVLSVQRRDIPKHCIKQVHLLQAFYAAIGSPSPGAGPGPRLSPGSNAFNGPGSSPGSSPGSGASVDEKAFVSIISEGLCGLFVRLAKGDFYPHPHHHHQRNHNNHNSNSNNNHNHPTNMGTRIGLGTGLGPMPTSHTTASTSAYPPAFPPGPLITSITSKDASREVHDNLLVTNGQRLDFLSFTEKLKAQKSDYTNTGYTLFQPMLWSIRYLRGCIAR